MPRRKLAALSGLIAVVALAIAGTFAAWTATTSNTGNSVDAGSVEISDNDGNTALFSLSEMVPGDDSVRCIEVTNDGESAFKTLALSMGGPYAGPTGLAQYLDLKVERGTGSEADCSDFDDETTISDTALNAFSTITESGPPTGWDPDDSKSYRFTVTLPTDAPSAAMSKSDTFDFTWTATVGD